MRVGLTCLGYFTLRDGVYFCWNGNGVKRLTTIYTGQLYYYYTFNKLLYGSNDFSNWIKTKDAIGMRRSPRNTWTVDQTPVSQCIVLDKSMPHLHNRQHEQDKRNRLPKILLFRELFQSAWIVSRYNRSGKPKIYYPSSLYCQM